MYAWTMKQYGLQMTRDLTKFLQDAEHKKHATDIGTGMHAKMQHVTVDKDVVCGDADVVNIIKNRADLLPFFVVKAQTEVAIAGFVHGVFVSRRIDRLLINHDTKTIDFIDYKTDTDKSTFIEQYKYQLKEYAELLSSAYPEHKINGYILWLHDWALDKII